MQRLAHAPLDVAGVGEEQPVVEAVDDDARRDARRAVHGDVGPAAEALVPSEHGVVRARAAADHVGDRERDGEQDRVEHPDRDDTGHGHQRDRPLHAVGRPQRPPRRRVDEPDAGVDDDGAEHRLREVGDRRREEEQHERDRGGGDHARDLRTRAHRVVDRGARPAGADREALRHPRRRVGGAHREQLRADVDALVVTAGERAGGQDLVGERHEEQADQACKIQDIPSIKFDHNLNDSSKFSFYYSRMRTDKDNGQDGLPDPISARRDQIIRSHTYRFNYDHTLSPTVILHAGVGYQRYYNPDSAPAKHSGFRSGR